MLAVLGEQITEESMYKTSGRTQDDHMHTDTSIRETTVTSSDMTSDILKSMHNEGRSTIISDRI